MKRSAICLNTSLRAQTALLDGGVIRIADASGQVLADVPLGVPAFAIDSDGRAVALGNQFTPASRSGKPARYQGLAADGTVIIEGPAGPGKECDVAKDISLRNDVGIRGLYWTAGD